MTKVSDPAIARELLCYLGSLPRKLQDEGTSAAAELALQVGNCLVWIRHHIEEGPQVDQTIDQTPVSVYALGKQLQTVGRKLWDKNRSEELAQMAERLEEVTKAYYKMESILHRAVAGKECAK